MREILSANQSWRFCRGKPKSNRPDETASFDEKRVWEMEYDDSAWEVVNLPHTVRAEALVCSGGRNYQGVAWYRRRFTVTPAQAQQDLLLEFEGAMQRIDLWLDGEPVGYREGGFLPQAFDLTGKVASGKEHLLVCKVDNSDMPDVPPAKPQGQLDFCYLGGIYRDAWLHCMGKIRFSIAEHEGKPASGGIFVRYPVVSKEKAVVRVKGHMLNHTGKSARAQMAILLDGVEVARSGLFTIENEREEDLEFTVDQPRLWHPYHPELYTLSAVILGEDGAELDRFSQRIGIRNVELTLDGAYINGEKIFLGGANRHQEYPYVGFAIPDAAQYRDARALRDAGVICVRTGHYPQDKAFMDACDELGILCVIPTPGWQIHPESVQFDLMSYENTRRLIRRDRNRPSAMLWEPILNETDYPEYFAKKQLEIVTEEMGDAPLLAACDNHYAYHEHFPINYGFRRTGGEAAKPWFVREYGDSFTEQFGPMGTLRRVRRGEGVSFYPGGERAMIRSAEERYEDFVLMKSIPALCGATMWAGIDHNRGYDNSEGAVGMLDPLRFKKFYYYLYEAQQDISMVGPKLFIANYWTSDSPRDVAVYTNAEAVRLLVNGREIGTLTAAEGWKNTDLYCTKRVARRFPMPAKVTNESYPDGTHPVITFKDVPFEPGTLRAEALVGGKIVETFEVRTPGAPVSIKLWPEWQGRESLTADGSDVLLIHAAVLDQYGTVCPTATNEIAFSVTGDAGIVGDGEAWAGANPVKAEAGMTGILLRAGIVPGDITVTAQSDGLAGGSVTVTSSPCTLPQLPGRCEGQPSEKPVYDCDKKERFNTISNMKLDSWYHCDCGTGKVASASSEAPDCPAKNANQGRIAEPWIAADTHLPQWWMCDLGADHFVYGVTASWYNDGLWYGYTVETSPDGKTWQTECENKTSGQLHASDKFADTRKCRYIRLNILSVSGDEPAGLYQLEIFGTPAQ